MLQSPAISDRPGVKFQLGPGSNFLAGAGGDDSGRGRGRGFLVNIWSPVLLAGVLTVDIFQISIHNET